MKFKDISQPAATPRSRLLLLFAGWGMDEKPFAALEAGGYDIVVLWDYRDPDFPSELRQRIEESEEIAVVAWSFGVPAATRFIASAGRLPLTARIAVNGTMHPVDDLYGIPEAIFEGTLSGLDEKSLSKFYLRMCGSPQRFRDFAASLPQRAVGELKEELQAIRALPSYAPAGLWDCAIVSDADRIIPAANQQNAWGEKGEAFRVIDIEGPHLPDFQEIISTFLTDKTRVAEKFSRASATYESNANIQREIGRRLCSMLPAKAGSALEIGGGTGSTTRMLLEASAIDRLEVWDLHMSQSDDCGDTATAVTRRCCDAETAIAGLAPDSLDLIFSASTVQWFNSLPVFLRNASKALRSGGMLLISTFGPLTMVETSASNSRRYPAPDEIRAMIPDSFEILSLEQDVQTLRFPSPAEALRHIRLTGVNALAGHSSAARTREILRSYPTAPDGSAGLTYQPVFIKLKKKRGLI